MINKLTWNRSTFDVRTSITIVAGTVAMFLAYAVTLGAGGTHTVFPHLFYVPILLFALRFGPVAGVISGITAGILCGPLMPLNVDTDTWQSTSSWLTRMGFFAGIGLLSGAMCQRMYDRHRQVEKIHSDAIRALVRTIDAKSPYTARHSERVAYFSMNTAAELGISKERLDHIYWSALMHDIGKLWLPDKVLNKKGALSKDEWNLMKQHPVFSAQLLHDVEEFHPYLGAVRGHHERYDGRGYPDGRSGEDIPIEARVLSVADSFEAMTADRPYRPALSYQEAILELQHNAGTQFDPTVVDAFCRAMRGESPAPVELRRDSSWPLAS